MGYVNESILYIIYSPVHKAVKIGISDISGKRFASHRQRGWLLVAYWHFFERDKARAVESLVIQTLNKKHKPFLSKEDMPQGGYTETFDASRISRKSLIRMVNRSIKLVNNEDDHK
jgi:predicted GIY-YIG superfamily endonuclease